MHEVSLQCRFSGVFLNFLLVKVWVFKYRALENCLSKIVHTLGCLIFTMSETQSAWEAAWWGPGQKLKSQILADHDATLTVYPSSKVPKLYTRPHRWKRSLQTGQNRHQTTRRPRLPTHTWHTALHQLNRKPNHQQKTTFVPRRHHSESKTQTRYSTEIASCQQLGPWWSQRKTTHQTRIGNLGRQIARVPPQQPTVNAFVDRSKRRASREKK